MNRRKFLGVVAGGAAASLSGCVTGRYPTGFFYGLLPKGSSEDHIRDKLISEGIDEQNIYINGFMNALQISGSYSKLKALPDKLELREYDVHSAKRHIPISFDSQDKSSEQNLREFSDLEELVSASTSKNSSVGFIDTQANWNSWYDTDKLNHKVVAQNLNPVLGPLLRDEDHGMYSAQTLFYPQQRVDSDGPYVQGIVSESQAYHAEISAIATTSQFFRSLCEGLEWMATENVDVIGMPLSILTDIDSVLSTLIDDFVTDLSNSIIVVSAGNVDVCNGDINTLADTSAREVVGVGSIKGKEENQKFSGQHKVSDILGPSEFRVGNNSYSGTSSSTTVISGVLGLYLSTLRDEYPNLSPEQYRDCALTGLLESSSEIDISRCDPRAILNRLNSIKGLQKARSEAEIYQ